MTLDIVLIVIGAVLTIIGILGCILPVLPGVPLSYIAIVLLHLTTRVDFSPAFLIGWGIVVIIVQILDYFVPIWGTKKLGGGKWGAWGCAIGVVVGMFIFPPYGIILFPFVGAVVGELLNEKEFKVALKAGAGAFVGFVAGTLLKLIVAFILAYYFFKEVILIFFQ
ncbi:uncharacterized protein YqgC (DUF456 family) [Dysgonomonas sp. PFB1-18]|uniref:DUF456 domain-containing protein n=1 Tax=unclassified Dysgonomonas TaxID=2630389 RepID=UPI002474E4EC|nr:MULTISPECIES: DUF456 domain-containing protein [unclassified Dysgonomonas]MDH6309706.1 uncharacterized protein YqgC (DUF456 family) [Dysgonomonas sp. PF1-14]MDH6339286.1 uncharacterized protein YqgC (DUF456 family) [Dysgonomonas sp. PF1-16]MDH6380785.1 uncharacterized protein YqgC (DUF456 family) [Dysgonomonas sp. PFB1-18]MDH6398281.1 uncharacterized protein YqgC (DUF456 family) [Dysgonomonas sp. PF1-23]